MYSPLPPTGHPVRINDAPVVVHLLTSQVHAGFPSPAEDLGAERLDLSKLLQTQRQDVYFMRIKGMSLRDLGIFDQDMAVIHRGKRPRDGDIVVVSVDGEFTAKVLECRRNAMTLKAANSEFPDIVPQDGQTVEVWGVVTAVVKQFRS
jgi:DNA polymerase V